MKKIIGKIIYKTTIILLVLSFLIQTIAVFPFYAFAYNEESLEKIELNNVNDVKQDEIKLLYEIEEYRDEYTKVFMRSDGKLQYSYYDELVNYHDGVKYQEIDASFKSEESVYSSTVNKYDVKLPKKINDNKKIKLQFDNSSIELSYLGINKSTGELIESSNSSKEIDSLKNIKSQILYRDIFNGVNLKLESSGSYFKENIILNKYIDNFSFEYVIKLKKLYLIEEENEIKFYNQDGKLIYVIDPYFMMDSSSNISFDVKIDYEMIKENEYKFKVTPNDEFLKDAQYPVTIDPVFRYVSNSTSSSIIKAKSYLKNTYTELSNIRLTKYINTTESYTEDISYYGILSVDFSQFDDFLFVQSAKLTLRGSSAYYEDPVVVREIDSKRTPYYNTLLDIDNIDGYTEYKTKEETLEFENISNNNYTINLTKYFNEPNNRTKKIFELSPELFSYNEATQYYNSNMSSEYQPCLNIILTSVDGMSPYRTYENINYRGSGDYYIDNLYGYGTYVVSLNDEYNVPLSLCYSSIKKDQNFGYGNGFKLSVCEKISGIEVDSNTYLTLTNGTGFKEYFYYDENVNKYLSEEGDKGYIEHDAEKDIYIYTRDNTKKTYNSNGYLVSINNKTGNDQGIQDYTIYIDYNESNLVSCISCNDFCIEFTYNNNGLIPLLEYACLKEYKTYYDEFFDENITIIPYSSFIFEYDENNNLKEVFKYNDDIKALLSPENNEVISEEDALYIKDTHLKFRLFYDYDKSSNLTKALYSEAMYNYNEYHYYYNGIYLEYDNNKVTSYGIKLLNDNNLKELMAIEYKNNYTIFTDYTSYKKTYHFDYFGHTISIIDSDGYAVCYEYEDYDNIFDIDNSSSVYRNKLKHISDPLNVLINPILNSSFEDYNGVDEIPNWTESVSGQDTARLVSNVFVPYGNNVLEVTRSSSNNCKYEVHQRISLSPGTYNLSAMARVSDSIYQDGVDYAGYLKVETLWGDTLQSTACEFNNPEFDFISSTFYVSEPLEVKIICGIKSTSDSYTLTGSDRVYIDNIQITNDEINNLYNIIPNQSFETLSNWTTVNSSLKEKSNITTLDDVEEMFGLKDLEVLHNGTATQVFNFNTKSNDKFNIGGFVNYVSGYGDLRIYVRFFSSTEAKTSDYYVLRFASGSSGYIYSSANITIDSNDVSNNYNRVEIKIENCGVGVARVDNLHLFNFHCGKSYEYDDSGNITKITSPDGETTYEYTDDRSVYRVTKDNKTYEISQESKVHSAVDEETAGPFVDEKDYDGWMIESNINTVRECSDSDPYSFSNEVLSFFTIDDEFDLKIEEPSDSVIVGNIKGNHNYIGQINIQKDSNNFGTVSGTVYDASTGKILTQIDNYGNITKYEYDNKNRISKIINSLDEYIRYSYNLDDNANTKYFGNSSKEQTISYIYDEYGNIGTLIINGNNQKKYDFIYDKFNYINEVYFNDDLLIKYEYLYLNDINTGLITTEYKINKVENDKTYFDFTKNLYNEDNLSIIECRKGLCYTSNPISFVNVSEFVVTKEEICYNCLYDSSGRIGYYKDFLENKSYYYNYDLEGKLIKINIFNDTVLDVMTNNHDYIIFTYDEKNNVIETNYYFDGESVITEYNYNNENNLDSIQINDTIFTNPKECVEGAKKFVEKSIGLFEGDFSTTIINEKLYYDTTEVLPIVKEGVVETALTGGNLKTYLGIVEDPDVTPISSSISSQEITINNQTYTFEYKYDCNGNIVYCAFDHPTVDAKDRTYVYSYELGQLKSETVYQYFEDKEDQNNLVLNGDENNNLNELTLLNAEYTYDLMGNITGIVRTVKRNEYINLPSNQAYTYNFKNQLLSYTIDGVTKTITYDEYGNPLTLGDYNLLFESGNLKTIQNNNNQYEYEYNSLGIRTKKTINGKVYEYTTYGDLLISETVTWDTNTYTVEYLYDANNNAIGFIYNSNTYYYIRNLQGEIIYIVNQEGYVLGEYKYDAYGNILNLNELQDVALINSIRYKGYYYDVETQLFYCNSRYYSPELCRWISPDSIEYLDPQSINGLNLYCYCGNNPVMGYDPNGTFDWNNFWKTALGVTAAVGLAALAIGATIVSGGSFGLLAAGFVMGAAASFVGQGIGNVLSGENFFNDFSLSSIIMGGLAGAAFITGVGGFWGAVAIGAVSNAGTSALENKSWANIGASAIVGGIAAGIGFGVGRVVSNHVFKNSGMTFMDYFELGIIDTNAIFAAGHAFSASWYTFLPSLATSASRGVTKALGNKGIGWF